jgi:hypothetical protein
VRGHRVGCLDAADGGAIQDLMEGQRAQLAIHDPPYNLAAFELRSIDEFIDWCRKRVLVTDAAPGPRLASSHVCPKETEFVIEVSHKISPTDST